MVSDLTSPSVLSPEHDLSAEHRPVILELAVAAIFRGNAAHRLQADTMSRTLGGMEPALVLQDLAGVSVFHLQQYHGISMNFPAYPDPA